ncbi:uncharacterized protein SCDLUD_002919 [Saccharomycodes ludwigii]|uniref:uncharacterized protein n=1 Tax=Saccharomycodes ludwigii TaxID=36035 RepID=UPI001E8980F8|nr:hypothetical protein SCDLUD_002919 [Saccharomycodes ludwigii]KAH3901426.1 hypothetical protein SCDLUD_002919 [Saccharomycodes ludwigii]
MIKSSFFHLPSFILGCLITWFTLQAVPIITFFAGESILLLIQLIKFGIFCFGAWLCWIILLTDNPEFSLKFKSLSSPSSSSADSFGIVKSSTTKSSTESINDVVSNGITNNSNINAFSRNLNVSQIDNKQGSQYSIRHINRKIKNHDNNNHFFQSQEKRKIHDEPIEMPYIFEDSIDDLAKDSVKQSYSKQPEYYYEDLLDYNQALKNTIGIPENKNSGNDYKYFVENAS